jgi:hypothetical protein
MVPYSAEGPSSHVERLADMHPVSRNFVQKEVRSLVAFSVRVSTTLVS